ncbi:MAG TPA: hypothetical protein VKV27_16825 [Solirubrobacteraceae bacterium]|nr:hypothetical protein [Solirubrobacteraceae bacterium]
MATLKQKIQAELATRALLQAADLPSPDRVEYGHGCIRLFWREQRVVLVIDVELQPDGAAVGGEGAGAGARQRDRGRR